MFIKIIKSYRDVVAVCDKEILGKTFEEENKILELKESFYKGKEVNEDEAIKILQDMVREDATFNIVGKKATLTNLTEEHGFIKRIAPGESFELTEKLEIIPNHACFTVNLYDRFVSVPDGHVYQVQGRGCNW